ncbi:DUF413 domain-containing protein [Rubrimonas cliftonensis]|uniref:Uncharacterized protein n=1 Tax=Rubrimonas cliftonensis TaxID=89524 RepID=A0A1H4ENB6_9RHOB|nr:DUF413 domain-containing protein [Rubrimonas cliftonensis]SEA86604.1 hypothetical protein SAMN05444370_11510 [Rubrimonas cliftonensis]
MAADTLEPLSQCDADLLRPCAGALVDLAEGRRPPQTEAQARFVDVAAGRLEAVSDYELAFMRWRALGCPPLDAAVRAPPKKKRKRRKPKIRTGMSVSAAKAPRKPRWTEADIARMHSLSGFNRIAARFVPGGRASPR